MGFETIELHEGVIDRLYEHKRNDVEHTVVPELRPRFGAVQWENL
ncbi:hypothetical protein Slin15195_G049040 [Septoria linicola]|uniref:Uncharacterized protein n=1 Tax=Septoria linicola TaxID=215465 RepID=A0A9Q9EI26_9PEZI|nr:hypothetical protein Slin15195_G049040 [Septoria linicola]